MDDIQKRIEAIEKEIRETPYHKGTEHHIGLLRARLAKLKDQLLDSQTRRRQGSGGSSGFALRKHGDATVVLVGLPSVGKSTLLNKLTNARSPTAEYAFTTVSVIPGMMKYKGAAIQILDVPGLIEGAAAGRGRGREVLSVVRGADLLLIIAESGREEDFNRIKNELHLNGVRIGDTPPAVAVKKELRGGLKVNSTVKQDLDYVPALYVINKVDLDSAVGRRREALRISAEKEIGLEELREAIWERLGLVRVYLNKPGRGVDREAPFILKQGQTLEDILEKIGSEFAEGKKEAKIWGPGARFPGQKVSLTTKVQDEVEVMFI